MLLYNEYHLPNLHPPSSRRQGIMLCRPFEERLLNKWAIDKYAVQPKLDGERCRALLDFETGQVQLVSSEGNLITSVPHITESLRELIAENSWPHKHLELDGELYNHNMTFEEIHSIVSRKTSIDEYYDYMEYHIFDRVSPAPFLKRYVEILNFVERPAIKLVKTDIVLSLDKIMEYLDRYIGLGYEGIIIRHPFATYERKRSSGIMKYKPHQSDTYRIVGTKQEKTILGQPKQSLGSFTLTSDDGTEFSVGSGLTEEQRKNYWNQRDDLIGLYVNVKYQSKTAKKVPRFPIFVDLINPDTMFND